MKKIQVLSIACALDLILLLSACVPSTIDSATLATSSTVVAATAAANTSATKSNDPPSLPPPDGEPSNPDEASNGGGDSGSFTGTAAFSVDGSSETLSSKSSVSSVDDQSAILVKNGGKLTVKGGTITTSGNATSMDNASFYGLNAAVLAQTNSTITMTGTSICTTGTGANGVFACGENAKIDLSDVTIDCKASGAHGVDATLGGVLNLKNVDITTAGDGAAAAIATDRGGGTISVQGGTVLTTGAKSPTIYSTGTIFVNNATLKSTGSEAIVIEGKNSVTAENCSISSTKNNGVFIYQSFSGDAEVGSGMFTMTGGTLNVSKGPLFYSTNTTAVINLKSAVLSAKSGILLQAKADQWGNEGQNGSNVTLNANAQTLEGSIILDSVSSAVLNLANKSVYTGVINTEKTAKSVSLNLDSDSVWNVTGDSILTALTDKDTTYSNIHSNGHTIYYNPSDNANAALSGKTILLADGGKITPIQ